MLDVASELQVGNERATTLQAAWRRRNTQGKFQTAVQEMMEINGLIEDIEIKEKELKEKQNTTALAIEQAMKQQERARSRAPNSNSALAVNIRNPLIARSEPTIADRIWSRSRKLKTSPAVAFARVPSR